MELLHRLFCRSKFWIYRERPSVCPNWISLEHDFFMSLSHRIDWRPSSSFVFTAGIILEQKHLQASDSFLPERSRSSISPSRAFTSFTGLFYRPTAHQSIDFFIASPWSDISWPSWPLLLLDCGAKLFFPLSGESIWHHGQPRMEARSSQLVVNFQLFWMHLPCYFASQVAWTSSKQSLIIRSLSLNLLSPKTII